MPIVRIGERLEHDVARARIVEAREEHQRAEPDVAVGVR